MLNRPSFLLCLAAVSCTFSNVEGFCPSYISGPVYAESDADNFWYTAYGIGNYNIVRADRSGSGTANATSAPLPGDASPVALWAAHGDNAGPGADTVWAFTNDGKVHSWKVGSAIQELVDLGGYVPSGYDLFCDADAYRHPNGDHTFVVSVDNPGTGNAVTVIDFTGSSVVTSYRTTTTNGAPLSSCTRVAYDPDQDRVVVLSDNELHIYDHTMSIDRGIYLRGEANDYDDVDAIGGVALLSHRSWPAAGYPASGPGLGTFDYRYATKVHPNFVDHIATTTSPGDVAIEEADYGSTYPLLHAVAEAQISGSPGTYAIRFDLD